MVCVIDIGFGNISSIKNWLSRCVIDFEIVENQRDLSDFKLIILPGVGSAPSFMKRLRNVKLIQEIDNANKKRSENSWNMFRSSNFI